MTLFGNIKYIDSMATRVTIQDIADSLGLSRNTVSKAINNTGSIASGTREAIFKKAKEMGYKLFSYATEDGATSLDAGEAKKEKISAGDFALFTAGILDSLHFSAKMLDVMQEEASKLGCGFTIYRITARELKEKKLPSSFDKKRTLGIFCVEMFDKDYCKLLSSFGLPLLFIDTPVTFSPYVIKADVLLMENRNCIYQFIEEMALRGKTDFAFVGEDLHCRSFFERYDAFRGALFLNNLEYRAEWTLTKNKILSEKEGLFDYHGYLTDCIKKWEKIPEVIICANDFIATDFLLVLRENGIRVPEDTFVCGFDDSPQALIVSPPLTSIHINAHDMGKVAMTLMLSRIEDPKLAYRTAYVQSYLVYRASTMN